MWDNLTCWQAASVGKVVEVNCPELFHVVMSPEDGEQRRLPFHLFWIRQKTLIQFAGFSGGFFFPCPAEMGKVSRNCTEDGWSEPFPHYMDVCLFYDNITKTVRPRSPGRGFPVTVAKETQV